MNNKNSIIDTLYSILASIVVLAILFCIFVLPIIISLNNPSSSGDYNSLEYPDSDNHEEEYQKVLDEENKRIQQEKEEEYQDYLKDLEECRQHPAEYCEGWAS